MVYLPVYSTLYSCSVHNNNNNLPYISVPFSIVRLWAVILTMHSEHQNIFGSSQLQVRSLKVQSLVSCVLEEEQIESVSHADGLQVGLNDSTSGRKGWRRRERDREKMGQGESEENPDKIYK